MCRRSLSGLYLLSWPREKGLEIPKLMILIVDGSSSAQRRFSGLMSRCTMPGKWMRCNAASYQHYSVLYEVRILDSTHCLIHDSNHHHTSTTLLLLCYACSISMSSECSSWTYPCTAGIAAWHLQYTGLLEKRDFLTATCLPLGLCVHAISTGLHVINVLILTRIWPEYPYFSQNYWRIEIHVMNISQSVGVITTSYCL